MLLILDKIYFSRFTIFALLFKFSHYGWKIEYLLSVKRWLVSYFSLVSIWK